MNDLEGTHSDARAKLRHALVAEIEGLLPGLHGYARGVLRRLGWAGGRYEESSRMSAQELVSMAVAQCIDGTRSWNPEAVDLAGFLRGVIRSLAWSEKKKHLGSRTQPRAELEEHGEQVDSPEDERIAEEGRSDLLAAIEQCIADDPELESLVLAVMDGHVKREDIAEALGWSQGQVSAARIKLQRRLDRRGPELFAAARARRRRKP